MWSLVSSPLKKNPTKDFPVTVLYENGGVACKRHMEWRVFSGRFSVKCWRAEFCRAPDLGVCPSRGRDPRNVANLKNNPEQPWDVGKSRRRRQRGRAHLHYSPSVSFAPPPAVGAPDRVGGRDADKNRHRPSVYADTTRRTRTSVRTRFSVTSCPGSAVFSEQARAARNAPVGRGRADCDQPRWDSGWTHKKKWTKEEGKTCSDGDRTLSSSSSSCTSIQNDLPLFLLLLRGGDRDSCVRARRSSGPNAKISFFTTHNNNGWPSASAYGNGHSTRRVFVRTTSADNGGSRKTHVFFSYLTRYFVE